jgi:hypothetical protein
MHRLQELFADAAGEQAFHDELRTLCEAGEFDRAEALLAAELETMDTDIARLCLELPREAVILSGWDDLVAVIAEHEGEPVTGVTLAIANELDLAFEKGQLHNPYVTLGIYTDEAYAFSAASAQALLEECQAAEGPAWAGSEEDVEIYLEVEGFGPLNTALIFHKQRHFFRDDSPDKAPMRYVDYVVGYWWRALRFQQAVAAEYATHGLPNGIPAVAGMIDMRPELICVHTTAAAVADPAAPVDEWAGPGEEWAEAEARDEWDDTPETAESSIAGLISRKPIEEAQELTGSSLRRRFANSEEPEPEPVKRGLLARLFGRGAQLDDAA